uniref:Sugar transport protein 7 n=1 Tax=Aegilops tauschii TaxID=37682 RepID=M8APX1_AEGTA
MAGSMAPLGVKKERAAEYKGHMTFAVAMACIVAAIGGSIFGYDIGISGVNTMDPFLQRFFPVVFQRKNSASVNNYCKYDNQALSAFTSILYLAGQVSTLVAAPAHRE